MRLTEIGERFIRTPNGPENPFVKTQKPLGATMHADAVRICPTFHKDAVKNSESSLNGYDVLFLWKGQIIVMEHIDCGIGQDMTLSGIMLTQKIDVFKFAGARS